MNDLTNLKSLIGSVFDKDDNFTKVKRKIKYNIVKCPIIDLIRGD